MMKCPICEGELSQKEHKYSIGARNIGYQSLKCNKCGEELVDEKEASKVFDEVAAYKKELHFKKKLSYSGNSLVLRIPAKLASNLQMRKGSTVDIIPGKKEFIVSIKA